MRINDKPATFREGDTILEVARRVGADIPTLCYDPRLEPAGSCRLCLVEIEGGGQPVPACTFPASEGVKVRTHSPELVRYRRRLLALVLSAGEHGAQGRRFRGASSGAPVDDGNPFILRDYDQCIYCYRCSRVCNEVEQAHAIVPGGRGFATRITTLFERGLMDTSCTFCGQCINTCPTGALADLRRVGKAKAADISKSVKTVCPFCGTGCTLYLDVAADRIVGVRPDFGSPVSRGSLCVKGQFGWEFVHSPDRLIGPLIRKGGQLREATWEEAYDLIAKRLASIKAAYGPNSIAFWTSARAANEANYLMQKFARAVIGTNNVDNCART